MGVASARSELVRRYGLSAEEKWQLLERHMELGSGFALVVLMVPDSDAAQLCRLSFAALLPPSQRLCEIVLELPELLYELPERLIALNFGQDEGAVWVAGTPRQQTYDVAVWMAGWRHAAARLNERRDVLRQQIGGPLVFCGPGWLGQLLRETAPDLWSVRNLVITIPAQSTSTGQPAPARTANSSSDRSHCQPEYPSGASLQERFIAIMGSPFAYLSVPAELQSYRLHPDALRTPYALMQLQRSDHHLDPELALTNASSLRHRSESGARIELRDLLLRAAYGFATRRNAMEVQRLTQEVLSMLNDESRSEPLETDAIISSQILALQSWAWLLQQDLAKAHRDAKRSIELGRSGQSLSNGHRIFSSSLLLAHEVWANAAVQLKLFDEVDVALDQLAKLLADEEDPVISVTLNLLRGLAESAHGRPALAEPYFRRAQNQQEQMGVAPDERAMSSAFLAESLLLQQKQQEAEQVLRLALAAFGDSTGSDDPVRIAEHVSLHGVLLGMAARRGDTMSVRSHAASIVSLIGGLPSFFDPVASLIASKVHLWAIALLSIERHQEAQRVLERLFEQQRSNSVVPAEQAETVKLLTTAMILAGNTRKAYALLKKLSVAPKGGEVGVMTLSPEQQHLLKVLSFGRVWPFDRALTAMSRFFVRRRP